MAFTLDASLSFGTATGYTLTNTVISGGATTLDTGVTGTGTTETPDINTSTWESMNKATIGQTESVGFDIRFLVSFDSGTTWQRLKAGIWEDIAAADIATKGMTQVTVESIRDWTPLGSTLRFLVGMTRATTTPTGEVAAISISYVASGNSAEPYLPTGEPTATNDLEADLDIQPDSPVRVDRFWPSERHTTGNNYEQMVSIASAPRRRMQLTWSGLTESERDTVVSFLEDNMEDAFTWNNAPGGSGDFSTASDPAEFQIGPATWGVAAEIEEVL